MAEYTSDNIANLIKKINEGRVILPSMQRNFVWPEEKVYHLFDSLMRDYPIGTFLFWDIDSTTFQQYVFNVFIKDIDEEKGKLQRGKVASASFSDYVAVLDGQQRITSIYVGITGKYRTHIKGKKWDAPESYFDRYLCLDLLAIPQSDDEKYQFLFVGEDMIGKDIVDLDGELHFWVKVADVFEEKFDSADFMDDFEMVHPGLLNAVEKKSSRKMLNILKTALREKPNVNYFSAKDKSLPEVVDVFVRVNSGGQKLSASDLMLSVAAGAQGEVDIHLKMQEAINYINCAPKDLDNGFKVDKELILTAGLLFTGAESLSLQKKENYSRERMDEIFLSSWENIIDALANSVQYIEHIGFCGRKLTSKNLILPIAYYFYKNNLTDKHKDSTSNRARCDAIFIRQWMLRAMINNVFMDGTGSTLLRIRHVIDCNTKKYYPLDELMRLKIKKSLYIGNEQISDIMELQYGDVRVLPLLMELAKLSPDTYHVDHIWPKDLLLTKRAIRSKYPTASDTEISDFQKRCHQIINLELLRPLENQEKSNMQFDEWINKRKPDAHYYDENCIPQTVAYHYNNFVLFTDERKKLLSTRVLNAFPDDFLAIVNRFGLADKII